MPITPPQVRVPTTGPRPSRRIAAVTMSPSDPANSSARVTSGPRARFGGIGLRAQPAAQVPADHPAGELLHHQLGGVAAAVAAHVEDQPVAAHLGPQVAVEVRPALAHHVRDVQVAEPAVAELADRAAAAGHPVLVAQPPLAAQRHDDDPARLARRAARTVSSTGLPAVPASSGHGPRTGSTGRPSTATISSPGRTATPGAASGERARGSDDSPGSTRSTSQRPAGVPGQVRAELPDGRRRAGRRSRPRLT